MPDVWYLSPSTLPLRFSPTLIPMRWTLSERRLASAPALAALALVLWGCGSGDTTSDVVRLGVAAPLEGYIGARTLRGAELARDEVNANGGISGRPLELAAVSDSADPRRAVEVADGFFADPTLIAVIGHANSGATLAAATIYNRGLVAISPTGTSPEISTAGPWIFRMSSSDEVNSGALARFALRELGSRAAILYANEPYGRGLREGFGRAFVAGGGTLLEEYPYIEGQTRNFEAYLLGIQNRRPNLVFVAGLDAGAGLIIQQARGLGITVPFMGGDGVLGLAGQGRVYEGTYVGLLYHPDASGTAGREFLDAYLDAYGEPPDHFAALAYDAVMLVARAAREVGADRKRIRDYLEQVGREQEPFDGVGGVIAFDANGDPVRKLYAVGQIVSDRIELISVEGGT